MDGFDIRTHHPANDFFVGLDVRARGTDRDRRELRPLARQVHEFAEPCLAAAESSGRRDRSSVDLPSDEGGLNIWNLKVRKDLIVNELETRLVEHVQRGR